MFIFFHTFIHQMKNLENVLERCKHKLHKENVTPSEVKVSAMAENASYLLCSYLQAIHIHKDFTKGPGLCFNVPVPALFDLLTVLCNQPTVSACITDRHVSPFWTLTSNIPANPNKQKATLHSQLGTLQSSMESMWDLHTQISIDNNKSVELLNQMDIWNQN